MDRSLVQAEHSRSGVMPRCLIRPRSTNRATRSDRRVRAEHCATPELRRPKLDLCGIGTRGRYWRASRRISRMTEPAARRCAVTAPPPDGVAACKTPARWYRNAAAPAITVH